MANVYVASSANLAKWAEDVGLTKYVYKVGVSEDSADEAVEALNEEAFAGQTDWKLIKKEKIKDPDEDALLAKLAGREKPVDPTFYPKIKGAKGIFKVKFVNAENHVIAKKALAGDMEKNIRIKPADIGEYLIHNATR
jgi:hypothetical protein